MDKSAQTVYTVNLELGMPTVEFALRNLELALTRARAGRYKAMKIIHGYGSSGTGGRIKSGVARYLDKAQASGKIKAWCRGEDFSAFDSSTQKMLQSCFELSRDPDYMKCNHGISMVLLYSHST